MSMSLSKIWFYFYFYFVLFFREKNPKKFEQIKIISTTQPKNKFTKFNYVFDFCFDFNCLLLRVDSRWLASSRHLLRQPRPCDGARRQQRDADFVLLARLVERTICAARWIGASFDWHCNAWWVCLVVLWPWNTALKILFWSIISRCLVRATMGASIRMELLEWLHAVRLQRRVCSLARAVPCLSSAAQRQ